MFITDIDGCLTDGGYYSPSIGILESGPDRHNHWAELRLPPKFYLRKFNTSDFVGIKMLHDAGIKCIALTGSEETSKPQFDRAGPYITVCAGVQDKYEFVRSTYVDRDSCTWDEIAFIGDEINDCKLLQHVGLAACPADATEEIKALIDGRNDGIRLLRDGGNKCVREFTDIIRKLRGIKASWCNWEED